MVDHDSMKLYVLNALVIGLSFTNLENILKIVLLFMSIVYTAMKIFDWIKLKKYNDANNSKETSQE